MADLDFITEIRIAQYWRKQLGEMEYVQRDPEDLRRWYVALETRGPEEIRQYLIERAGRYPPGEVTGIVSKAPHPSREIIDLWLTSHEKASTTPYWLGMAAFLIACMLIAPNVSGCQHLRSINLLANMTPPASLKPAAPGPPPQPQSTLPGQFPLPANTAGRSQPSGQGSH